MGLFFCTPLQSGKSSRVTHLFLRETTDTQAPPIVQIVILRRVFEEVIVIDSVHEVISQTNSTIFGSSGMELYDEFDLQIATYGSVDIEIPKPIESFIHQMRCSHFLPCKQFQQKNTEDSVVSFKRIIMLLKLFLDSIGSPPSLTLINSTLLEYQRTCAVGGNQTSTTLQFSGKNPEKENLLSNNSFLLFLQQEGLVNLIEVTANYVSFFMTDIPYITVNLDVDDDKNEHLCSALLYGQRVNVPCNSSLP
jgi:hypothetical protein